VHTWECARVYTIALKNTRGKNVADPGQAKADANVEDVPTQSIRDGRVAQP